MKNKNPTVDFTELARKLREIYPAGRKPGTNYQWRGSTAEIAKKLKTLYVKYEFEFTEEDAIDATQRYIESFHGDYTFMRLLKYFILKTTIDGDGNSDIKFMSLIENAGQEDDTDDKWIEMR